MNEQMPWWQSRTIWTGLATSLVAVLAAAGLMPPFLDGTIVTELVLGVLGMATIYTRVAASKQIATPSTVTPVVTEETKDTDITAV